MAETTYRRQDALLNVAYGGRLDSATSPALEKELREHLEGIRNVVMDFSSVEYVSSGGIRMLLAIEQLLDKRGGRLSLTHVNEYVLEVFELVGFMDVVEVIRG